MIISLRHRDDIGFMRNGLEILQQENWFNLYYIDSGNDVEYGKSQMLLAIEQET